MSMLVTKMLVLPLALIFRGLSTLFLIIRQKSQFLIVFFIGSLSIPQREGVWTVKNNIVRHWLLLCVATKFDSVDK